MRLKTLLSLTMAAAVGQFSVSANTIGYDEILTDGTVDPSKLSAEVCLNVFDSDTLELTLQNTSLNSAGSGAGVLLTGIGMVWPGWATLEGGSATVAGGAGNINFDGSVTDVSSEWGYDVDPLNSGALQDTAQPVNTAISSMTSQTKDGVFAEGSVAPPPGLGGPDFGLASASETDPFGMGVEAIQDSITILLDLSLNGSKSVGDLISYIDSNWVALTFGSPTGAKPPTSVPEGGATVLLLGFGLWATEMMRRKVQSRK
jgi:hypothetical protein